MNTRKVMALAALLAAVTPLGGCQERTYTSREPDHALPTKSDADIAIEEYASENGMTAEAAKIEIQKQQEIQAAQSKIDAVRHADKSLNWMRIGISTGKFSESINGQVYKTNVECVAMSLSEANVCLPIRALPESYWNAAK